MPSTRTHTKPTAEQKDMCHMVSVMGKGKPEKASSLEQGKGQEVVEDSGLAILAEQQNGTQAPAAWPEACC